MKLEYKHQETYTETTFYMIYRISFSHNYHISAVQEYILPSLFIAVNENANRYLNVMGTEMQTTELQVQ
jgi:hypothetical protein